MTIKDIARIAGVSTSTVSRALSNSPELSEQTRQRILEICRREGYRVNALARSLICNKTNVIGLIVPELTSSPLTSAGVPSRTVGKRGTNFWIMVPASCCELARMMPST